MVTEEFLTHPFVSSSIFNCSELKLQHDWTIHFELCTPFHSPSSLNSWGAKIKQLIVTKSIKAPKWAFSITQSFFSGDLVRFWSLGDPGVKLWRLIERRMYIGIWIQLVCFEHRCLQSKIPYFLLSKSSKNRSLNKRKQTDLFKRPTRMLDKMKDQIEKTT